MYYNFLLLYVFSIYVSSKKHIYYKTHNEQNQITLNGQIVTPALLDLGIILPLNITIERKKYNIMTEISGKFTVKVVDLQGTLSGAIEANFQDQFTQTFYFDHKPIEQIVDLGKFILNNNQTQKTLVSGRVVDSYSGQPINRAQVTLNFTNPINLGVFYATTGQDGIFTSQNSVMRLLLYGVQITVSAKGYADWDRGQQNGIILYNTYEFNINNISLTLKKLQAVFKVKVVKNSIPQSQQMVCATCLGQEGRYFQAQPNTTNSDGIAILNSQINQDQLDKDYFCTIWTNNSYELIRLTDLLWDGTMNQTLYLKI